MTRIARPTRRKPYAPVDVRVGRRNSAEYYGAKGDGSTDDSAAIQLGIDALSAEGGGVLVLSNKLYRAAFTLKQGVLVMAESAGMEYSGGPSNTTVSPPTGWAGGWVIDSPATQILSCGVIGLNVSGGVTGSGSTNAGGIRIQQARWSVVQDNTVAATSLGSVKVNGTANKIRGNQLQNLWTWRTPTVDEGVLDVSGTDAIVQDNYCNGGLALGTDDVSSATLDNLHKIANKFTLTSSWILGGNGEFSEIGWKISMYESTVWGLRGDVNLGPGLYVTPSTSGGTQYSGIFILANCLSATADGVLDQMIVSDYANTFDGIFFGPDFTGSGRLPRYALNDIGSNAGFNGRKVEQTANKYRRVSAEPGSYKFDVALRASGGENFKFKESGAGNPARRPESRFSAGRTWWDTVGNKLTISDGTNWRDTSNVIVGNIMNKSTAYATDGVLRWSGLSSNATVALVAAPPRWYRGQVVALTTTATGVTNGKAQAVDQNATATAVTAGETYQLGCYASGPASKTNTAGITARWLTSGGAFISDVVAVADSTSISAGDSTVPTLLLSAGMVAPASAAFVEFVLTGKNTTLATGDVFKFGSFSVTVGSAQTDVNEI